MRVAYIVGDTPGRDHQYWPTILHAELVERYVRLLSITQAEAEALVTASENAEINLATIMQMAWAVREWKVTAGMFSYTGIGPASENWTMAGSWEEFRLRMKRVKNPPDELDPLRDVTDEQDILGPSSDYPFTDPEWPTLRNAGVRGKIAIDAHVTDPPFDINEPRTGEINGSIFGGYVIYNPVTKKFYPAISVDGGVFPSFGFARVSFFTTNVQFLVDNPAQNAHAILTIVDPAGGTSIVLPLAILGYHIAAAPEGTGTVTNIEMTAVKWWPYETLAGEPVYNESTGAPLDSDPKFPFS